MGEVFRFKNIVVRIWSNDHEPPHVHIEAPDASAIFLLDTLEVRESEGFSSRDIKRIREQLEMRKEKLLEKWEEIHGKS